MLQWMVDSTVQTSKNVDVLDFRGLWNAQSSVFALRTLVSVQAGPNNPLKQLFDVSDPPLTRDKDRDRQVQQIPTSISLATQRYISDRAGWLGQ